jgi:hypothetical protein
MSLNEYNSSSTRREDWCTPDWLFNKLDSIFNFKIDLASNEENTKCGLYVNDFFSYLNSSIKNNYSHVWKWCNPPYNRNIFYWINGLLSLTRTVVLLPANVGAKNFSGVWSKADAIWFLNKRLFFKGAKWCAKFDSCIAIKGYYPILGDDSLEDHLTNRTFHNLLVEDGNSFGTVIYKSGISII